MENLPIPEFSQFLFRNNRGDKKIVINDRDKLRSIFAIVLVIALFFSNSTILCFIMGFISGMIFTGKYNTTIKLEPTED